MPESDHGALVHRAANAALRILAEYLLDRRGAGLSRAYRAGSRPEGRQTENIWKEPST